MKRLGSHFVPQSSNSHHSPSKIGTISAAGTEENFASKISGRFAAKRGSSRLSKGDLNIHERRRRRWLKTRQSRPVPICHKAFHSRSSRMEKRSSVCRGGET